MNRLLLRQCKSVGSFGAERAQLYKERANGSYWPKALKGHTKTQHGGQIDSNCPACRELSAKIKQ